MPLIRSPPRDPATVKATAPLVILAGAITPVPLDGARLRVCRLGQAVGGVEEHLLQRAGQVAAPRQGCGRGQRMVLEADPDHAVGAGRARSPDRPGLAACGDGRAGQDGGGPVPGRGQGQGHGQRVPEGRVGELEARVDCLHRRGPGVVDAWLRPARPVDDLQGGQFLQADGAAAGRGWVVRSMSRHAIGPVPGSGHTSREPSGRAINSRHVTRLCSSGSWSRRPRPSRYGEMPWRSASRTISTRPLAPSLARMCEM